MSHQERMSSCDRREFLRAGSGAAAALALSVNSASVAAPQADKVATAARRADLVGALGIVSASAGAQLSGRAENGSFKLLDLPRVLREELDMRVIDLNTSSFESFETVDRAYLDRFRDAVEEAGCVLTNLKMNQKGLDMNSRDANLRQKALAEYKRSIDIASHLGIRWARPLPGPDKPDLNIHVASYQQLCDYAAQRNIQMLVENFGWMQSDPNSVVQLVNAIGRNVAAGLDTGNWNDNQLRYAALAKTFPIAVTCDFKARTMGPRGEHPLYDLRRCFEIGWSAGFRGPWCFEHGNRDTKALMRELGLLRDMIRNWTLKMTR